MRLHVHQNAHIEHLPLITSQSLIQQDWQMLAVVFDITNFYNTSFYPHFSQKKSADIVASRQDFLWETSCYELFIAFDDAKDTPYVEVNFSAEGQFNVYHFDAYRTPPDIPPRRLDWLTSPWQRFLNFYHITGEMPEIFWQKSLANQQAMQKLLAKEFPLATDHTRLAMLIDLKGLAHVLTATTTDKVWLNPCVVYQDKKSKEMAYFAHQHVNPPDFHDKASWIKLGI